MINTPDQRLSDNEWREQENARIQREDADTESKFPGASRFLAGKEKRKVGDCFIDRLTGIEWDVVALYGDGSSFAARPTTQSNERRKREPRAT